MTERIEKLQNLLDYGFDNALDIADIEHNDDSLHGLSGNAQFLLETRYFLERYDSQIKGMRKEKSFSEMCTRIARVLASGETLYTEDVERIRLIENNIFNDTWDRRFLFNSPALFNLGVHMIADEHLSDLIYEKPTLSYEEYKELYDRRSEYQMAFACFVIPVNDTLPAIYDSVKNAALISMKGGGVGTNFGRTREKGAPIRSGQGGFSSGPISWMKQWNTMAEEVVQGGKRRAALMGMIDVNHPDIEDFISCKDNDNVLSYFNISVAITDEFMDAVENDRPFTLKSRVDPSLDKVVNARELWSKICEHAWKRGDPGIHFVDISNQDSLLKMSKNWIIECTNPCGEMNLPFRVGNPEYKSLSVSDFGCERRDFEPAYVNNDSENGNCCNLGSINLTKFVRRNNFDISDFSRQIRRSIYYLDLVIDVSKYPLEGIGNNTKSIRPVGLGFMGLHDTGIMLGMPFDPKKSFGELCATIAYTMGIESLIASAEIVSSIGKKPFPESECVGALISEIASKFGSIENALESQEKDKLFPFTLRNTLKMLKQLKPEKFNYVVDALKNGRIRNSRRLSIAPTGCQVAETYISTADGLLRLDEIGNVNSSEKWSDIDILVEQETKTSASDKFFINGLAKTKKITLQSGLTFECTHNHQYRVLDNNGIYSWKRADQLKIGDRIVYKIGEYQKETNPVFNFETSRKHGNLKKYITFPKQMNEDLAYFIGVYLGDGSISYNKRCIRVCFNKKDEEKLRKYCKIVKRLFNCSVQFEPKYGNPKRANMHTTLLYSTEVIQKLEIIGSLKKNSLTVSIPRIIRQSSRSCILAFIEGYFSADGTGGGKNKYKVITTVSHRMAKEMLMLMRMVGINGRITSYLPKDNFAYMGRANRRYRIFFGKYGSDSFEKSKERFVPKEDRKNHEMLTTISNRLFCDLVTEIADSENVTYDIQVPDGNTYIANSFISHNTISMLCDTSSGLEPNFAFAYKRRVKVQQPNGESRVEIRDFVNPLVPLEYKDELQKNGTISDPVFRSAMEISPDEHIGVVEIFNRYVDASISKTINLQNNASIEDIKNIYTRCHQEHIKGITIYRDGSRSEQPIIVSSKKEKEDENQATENQGEAMKSLLELMKKFPEEKTEETEKIWEMLSRKMIASRKPKKGQGSFMQVKTPYGTIHISAKFNNRDEMCEVFITINKSGQELKAITEALSRLISIALQESVNYKETYRRLMKTMKGIAGFEAFVYDGEISGQEHVCKSIPDLMAYALPDLEFLYLVSKYGSKDEALKRINARVDIFQEQGVEEYIEKFNKHKLYVCPECGSSSFYKSDGCDKCLSCGYSKCSIG